MSLAAIWPIKEILPRKEAAMSICLWEKRLLSTPMLAEAAALAIPPIAMIVPEMLARLVLFETIERIYRGKIGPIL